ncbi:permease for cytosine/purines, uracil, thiamine, allantoin [Desulforamulus reducens MI-1]|uniref:Permease for cytosine/purines, uracil, thiamine, allantoin n=1 Tax=Desulforamulus reducens (strain ATCC BAA-1160 / DSM 100696 / MI-1) TaxID=349161 RepID=A4J158_DESRM|nr:cytosine permease [Desulforamulus reducens]ABO48811.1 permease for cytosine/purines, uracil, thiamine, allantoin [Desulforamulus reducens MI-1]
MTANSNEVLRNSELLPTTDAQRTMSLADYIILWAGMTINVVAFSLGAQYYDGGRGLSPWTMIFVMTIGYGLVTALTAMVGDIGTKYGVPFAAYTRAPFGYKGSYVAGLIRAIPGMYWFGFLTWVGASAINQMLGIIFPGFSNLTLMIILFAAIQIFNTMYGLHAMAKFDWVAIPCLAIMFGAILVASLQKYNITLPDIMATPAEGQYSLAYAIAGIAGGWITMSLNGSDLSRQIKRVDGYEKKGFFARNQRSIIGQVVGLMMVGIGTMLVGVVTGITSGYWDLNQVIPDLFQSKTVLILSFLVIMFAQWSTNTAANLLPPTLVLLNIFPKLKYWMSAVICGVISVGMMPWKLQSQGGFLVMVQAWISQMLGPIIGILLVDYFLIRKCKLNVRDLYVAEGQYQYTNGFNISAMVTIVVSFFVGLLCGDYAFFAGLACSAVLYYVLMKAFTLKKYNQHIGEEVLFDPEKD